MTAAIKLPDSLSKLAPAITAAIPILAGLFAALHMTAYWSLTIGLQWVEYVVISQLLAWSIMPGVIVIPFGLLSLYYLNKITKDLDSLPEPQIQENREKAHLRFLRTALKRHDISLPLFFIIFSVSMIVIGDFTFTQISGGILLTLTSIFFLILNSSKTIQLVFPKPRQRLCVLAPIAVVVVCTIGSGFIRGIDARTGGRGELANISLLPEEHKEDRAFYLGRLGGYTVFWLQENKGPWFLPDDKSNTFSLTYRSPQKDTKQKTSKESPFSSFAKPPETENNL